MSDLFESLVYTLTPDEKAEALKSRVIRTAPDGVVILHAICIRRHDILPGGHRREGRETLIICPFCGEIHTHGYFAEGQTESRVGSHCSTGEGGVYILWLHDPHLPTRRYAVRRRFR